MDKAAKLAGLTLSEMMQEIAARGIKLKESLEEYRAGMELLLRR